MALSFVSLAFCQTKDIKGLRLYLLTITLLFQVFQNRLIQSYLSGNLVGRMLESSRAYRRISPVVCPPSKKVNVD